MEEYIIISKTAIQKRIEELKHQRELTSSLYDFNQISTELRILEQILSQSTSLIPVIEDTFKASKIPYKVNDYGTFGYENVEHYIETLKLDI